MDFAAEPLVKVTISNDGVGLLELNRAKKRNALSRALLDELIAAIELLEQNDAVRVVVFTGSPGGPFCAGADIGELVNISTADAHRIGFLKDLADAFGSMRKPIIAAVLGFGLGGGFEIAMMCDMIYAATDAKLGLPEVKIGTIPGAGGTQRLTRALGKAKAMEMILTGEPATAVELEKLGVVTRALPAEEVLDAALKCARTIAAKSSPVIKLAKQAILIAESTDFNAGLKMERMLYYSSFSLEDRREGMKAFLEKRQPTFQHN